MKYKAVLYFMDTAVREMDIDKKLDEILVPITDNKLIFTGGKFKVSTSIPKINDMLVFKYVETTGDFPNDEYTLKYVFDGVERHNQRYGHNKFYTIIEDLALLHGSKNKDYAEPDRPLGNFERVGRILDELKIKFDGTHSAEKVAFIYSLKQIDAVGILLGKGEQGKVEGRGNRYNDVAVYSIIGRILNEENK